MILPTNTVRILVATNPVDFRKTALKWLKLAATPSSGRSAVYMLPVGGAAYGTVMMMDTGQATAGHGKAQFLLAVMYDKGGKALSHMAGNENLV